MTINWIGWDFSKNKYVVKDAWQPIAGAEFDTIEDAKAYALSHGAPTYNGALINVGTYDPPRAEKPISSVTVALLEDLNKPVASAQVGADLLAARTPVLQEALAAAANAGVDISGVSKISDVLDAIKKTNEIASAPTNTGVIDTPTNTGVIDTPTNTGVIDTPTNTGVIDTPTNTGVIDKPTNTGVINTPTTSPSTIQFKYDPQIAVPENTVNMPQSTGISFDVSKISAKTIAIAGVIFVIIVLALIDFMRGRK